MTQHRTRAIKIAARVSLHLNGLERALADAQALAVEHGNAGLAQQVANLQHSAAGMHDYASGVADVLGDDPDFGPDAETYSGGHGDKDTTPP